MPALLNPLYRRSLLMTGAVTAIFSLPLYAHAALPESIQSALDGAALTSDNISILITPVGHKNSSRLPSVITVTDQYKPNINVSSTNASSTNTANINALDKAVTPLIIIEKQTIELQEQQLQAYTDDAYTHQSLVSMPPIVPKSGNDYTDSSVNDDGNVSSNDDVSKDSIATPLPLVSHYPDSARTPASTMKLIPSFIALDTLGADFVWFTRIYHTGLIIGNRLQGDLIIQGSGDPKMTHERLEQMLYRVGQAGIHHIDGDIIVDSAIFNNVTKDPASFDRAPLRPYNASPDGFLVNFNSVSIRSHSLANNQAQLSYEPQLANYQLPSKVNTREASCSSARYSLAPKWQTDKLTFDNPLPERCGEHVFYVAYPDAKDFASRVIAAKWQALGNTLTGTVRAQEKPYTATSNATNSIYPKDQTISNRSHNRLLATTVSPLPLVSYPSLNLTQQIYDINHFSNNVMTEQVALSIGSYAPFNVAISTTASNSAGSNTTNSKKQKLAATSLYQFDKPNTTDYPQALQTMTQWWQTHLITPPPFMTNGSGLCRECTVSAANLSELLGYAYNHSSFDAYVDSLGVAGVSGTISHHSARLPDSGAIGRAWIKTGTLNNVTAMAGYVKGQSGQDYTVVGIINAEQAINADDARVVLDTMLDWTAQH
ncbi:D-alanyl-D-alanine carboxypeptidase/D-alanyl-D-alanine-endopeptidase [Psychrobacter sp. M13]|uniref:D-alanyl-D-alanine carboxypeptidase/D-alanyl-D-alanine-endopeptidase n=1 Tax=Psychrobacter sp. M13 TaxID=3067275 RepID=UPI00273AD32A|nr:D-alanyl-D-alanine carboxypeptidase [Psychrobacter sp. M13]WLP95005.1 D-alanyl-D-alanine carboxypeptidase [Psychrobacter sp. M13]